MQIELYKLLNVADFSADGPNKTIGRPEIEDILSNLRQLEDELASIAARLTLISKKQIDESFFFDFEVIYASINWLNSLNRQKDYRSTESFWSSLALTLFAKKAYFLPGTLYELLRFLKKQNTQAHAVVNSAIAESFVQEFFNARDANPDSFSDFRSTIKSLSQVEFGETTFFVLKRLFKEMPSHNVFRGRYEYDPEVFQSAYYSLSVGQRREKYINNRVDALNFAMCAFKNQQEKKSHDTIISNSPVMRRLNGPLHTYDNASAYLSKIGGNVMSTRQACIYKLLLKFAGTTHDAEQMCRLWITDVQEFRYRLNAFGTKFTGNEFLRPQEVLERAGIVSLLWMFEGLQKEISRIKHRQLTELNAFKSSYKHHDFISFTKDLEENIESKINATKYAKMLNGGSMDEDNVEINEFFNDQKSGVGVAYELVANNAAINVSGGSDGFRIWARHDVEFFDFTRAIVTLCRSLKNKFFADHYLLKTVVKGDPEHFFSQGSWQVNSENKKNIVAKGMGDDFDLENYMKTGVAKQIKLMRYVCPLFSCTYDGKMIGIRTEYDISRDISDFMDDLLSPSATSLRSKKGNDTVLACVQNAELHELKA